MWGGGGAGGGKTAGGGRGGGGGGGVEAGCRLARMSSGICHRF